MTMLINDKEVCECGAYWNTNGFCSNGHPKGYPMRCDCGGTFKKDLDEWPSRMRCERCGDYFDL